MATKITSFGLRMSRRTCFLPGPLEIVQAQTVIEVLPGAIGFRRLSRTDKFVLVQCLKKRNDNRLFLNNDDTS